MWDKKQSVREIKRNSSRLRGCSLIKWKDSGPGQASAHITITITTPDWVFREGGRPYRTPAMICASLRFVKFAAKLANFLTLEQKECNSEDNWSNKAKKPSTLTNQTKWNQEETYSEQGVQTPHHILWKETNKNWNIHWRHSSSHFLQCECTLEAASTWRGRWLCTLCSCACCLLLKDMHTGRSQWKERPCLFLLCISSAYFGQQSAQSTHASFCGPHGWKPTSSPCRSISSV